jgi:hypothetical protein
MFKAANGIIRRGWTIAPLGTLRSRSSTAVAPAVAAQIVRIRLGPPTMVRFTTYAPFVVVSAIAGGFDRAAAITGQLLTLSRREVLSVNELPEAHPQTQARVRNRAAICGEPVYRPYNGTAISLWQKSWQAEARPTWCRKQLIHRGGAGAFACEPGGMGLLPQAAMPASRPHWRSCTRRWPSIRRRQEPEEDHGGDNAA